MRSQRLRGHPGVVLLCVALVVGPMMGCGDDDDTPASPTTTAPSSSSTTPSSTAPVTTASPDDDETALRHLAEEWFEVARRLYAGDNDTDQIALYLVARYLDGFITQLENFRASDRRAELSRLSDHAIESISIVGDSASLVECVLDADLLLDEDGNVLNDDATKKQYETIAMKTRSGWRLSDRIKLAETDGESC